MKTRNVLTMVIVAAFPVLFPGCGLVEELNDNDTPTGDTDDAASVCADLLEETVCDPPFTAVYVADIQDENITWVDDPGISIGDNGIGADGIAYINGGNASCAIACRADFAASCFHYGGTPCEAGDCATTCIMSGSSDTCSCVTAICNDVEVPESCFPPGDDDNSGGDSGGADETGGADGGGDSSGGASPAEGVALDEDTLLWTTPETLDMLDGKVAATIVTRACDAWEPGNAVGEWLGDPFVSRADLQETLDHAGTFLADCDGLRVELVEKGVLLSSVQEGTLASLLGFKEGDLLLGLNDVPATDLLGLTGELARIAEDSASIGTVTFLREGTVRTQRIRVGG